MLLLYIGYRFIRTLTDQVYQCIRVTFIRSTIQIHISCIPQLQKTNGNEKGQDKGLIRWKLAKLHRVYRPLTSSTDRDKRCMVFIFCMASAGSRLLGQVAVQFFIIWHLYSFLSSSVNACNRSSVKSSRLPNKNSSITTRT